MASKPPPELTGPPIDVSAAGATLRDYFAAAALTTMLQKAGAKTWNIKVVADWAYRMADAMVERSMDVPSEPSPPISVVPMPQRPIKVVRKVR